ncbi:hypothetical protein LTR17_002783 [Elasticomyces elasticus]|nr:hypothetical protein LTR17_002783 [Elasticomyces elasticus]
MIEPKTITYDEGFDNELTTATASWIGKLGLDHQLLDQLLGQYRSMQHFFPFVVVLPDWTSRSMMQDRPFLLLAAVANAANHYPRLQDLLAKEIREILADQIVIAGETSLDLLSGMLLHLAWSHHFATPRSQQAYRYLQLAISMLVDLGLDDEPNIITEKRGDAYVDGSGSRIHDGASSEVSNEAARPRLSSSMCKPNTLPLSNAMLSRATTLGESPDHAFDPMLLPLVNYQLIIENVHAAYSSEKRSGTRSRLHLHAKRMMASLDQWKASISDELWITGLFSTKYYGAKIWVYEMGLLYHFRIDRRCPVAQDLEYADQSPLIGSLVSCVDAIKQYLDVFLLTDALIRSTLPFEEWCRFVLAFFVLYKLSVGLREVPAWDVELCRRTVDLDAYLSAAIENLRQAARGHAPSDNSARSLSQVLPDVLESVKASYRATRDSPSPIVPDARVHFDMSKKLRIPTKSTTPSCGRPPPRGCPAASFWTAQALDLDNSSDWHGVRLNGALDPSAQLEKNENLWTELLSTCNGKE